MWAPSQLTASTPGNAAPGLQQGTQEPAASMEEVDLFYTKVSSEAARKRFELEMTTQREGPKQSRQVQEHADNSLAWLIEELISKGALLDLRIREELLANVKVGQHLVQCLQDSGVQDPERG